MTEYSFKRWRWIENEWNLKFQPWSDAVGIEEIDDDALVPAIVCWFTRGWPDEVIDEVISLHNKEADREPWDDRDD